MHDSNHICTQSKLDLADQNWISFSDQSNSFKSFPKNLYLLVLFVRFQISDCRKRKDVDIKTKHDTISARSPTQTTDFYWQKCQQNTEGNCGNSRGKKNHNAAVIPFTIGTTFGRLARMEDLDKCYASAARKFIHETHRAKHKGTTLSMLSNEISSH